MVQAVGTLLPKVNNISTGTTLVLIFHCFSLFCSILCLKYEQKSNMIGQKWTKYYYGMHGKVSSNTHNVVVRFQKIYPFPLTGRVTMGKVTGKITINVSYSASF